MKKLLIVLLTLISTYSYGQAVLSGSKGWNGYIDTGADSLITRMETATSKTMTADGKQMLSDIFTMYKDSLLITSLQNFFDVLYFLDIGVESAAKLNWVKDAHNITNVNSVVFDTVGATGNGSSSYLNMNYTPSTEASNFTLNAGSYGIYYPARGNYSFGSLQTGKSLTGKNSNPIKSSFNINDLESDFNAVLNEVSFFIMNRSDTATVTLYSDNANQTKTKYSGGLTSNSLYICGYNPSGYSSTPMKYIYVGKSADATTQRKIRNIVYYWKTNKNSITFFNE